MIKPHNHRIKLLLILHQLTPGGAPKVAIDVLEALGDRVEVRVISIGDGQWKERVARLFPLFIYRLNPCGSTWLKILRWLLRPIRSAIWSIATRLWNPDIVYCNSVSSLIASDLVGLPNAPTILHVHETGLLLEIMGKRRHHLMKSLPDRYLAVSQNVCDSLTGTYGVAKDAISVIHNSVEMPLASSDGVPDSSKPFVVGGVGMMSWIKGGDLWLQMAQELLRLVPDREIRFVWVGVKDDVDGRRFREMASKLGVQEHIEMLEAQADLSHHYVNFDVVAVTSWEESFSLVALEAMSYGKPVACFAGSGGTPEVIGDAGLVIPDFSPRMMAESIASLVRCPNQAIDLGSRARVRAESCFALGRQVELIYDEIQRVARGGG